MNSIEGCLKMIVCFIVLLIVGAMIITSLVTRNVTEKRMAEEYGYAQAPDTPLGRLPDYQFQTETHMYAKSNIRAFDNQSRKLLLQEATAYSKKFELAKVYTGEQDLLDWVANPPSVILRSNDKGVTIYEIELLLLERPELSVRIKVPFNEAQTEELSKKTIELLGKE